MIGFLVVAFDVVVGTEDENDAKSKGSEKTDDDDRFAVAVAVNAGGTKASFAALVVVVAKVSLVEATLVGAKASAVPKAPKLLEVVD